ncbi:MAG: NADH-quinone oxidoreductase subunit L [Planctomycetales bacterium]|nr:NADH-quinone oxidoreductase subunit L [Planctomycetales bacterium]
MDPQTYQSTGEMLRNLLTLAWLLPLAGFVLEVFAGYWSHRLSRAAAYSAVFCIAAGFVCSFAALMYWGHQTHWSALESHASPADHHDVLKYFSGTYYTLAEFGKLRIAIDYHIDSLTLVMFTMVTLIATMIHIFAIGYMSDELTEHYEDHQVHTAHGHFHRPGRFYMFFAYLSLFSFSMLGLVLAGNVFQVFVFWELVGVCSYFLIGFYFERKSASTAANKAFIMNRVGDFGFLIGLMILWTWFGTFQFNERVESDANGRDVVMPGLFDMLRDDHGNVTVLPANDHDSYARVFLADPGHSGALKHEGHKEGKTMPYFLLVVAGLGIFAGCVGKSAQFPLQTWLPDAMEGPTPVSALVHSATMVAAGVYLAGRFYPMFLPEVLLTIAYVGCITLFMAATIAVVATDIKRVLAYSTISQLGYMMLGIGVGGWTAGLFHLITHAFFKSLMFLCSGSVIHGCHHEQEMPKMGGLIRKMPITAYTMLVGVIAICGLAIPGISIFGIKIAFSGYHSKDAIIATAMTFSQLNGSHFLLFVVPLLGAGITAFYMFRLWFYTFIGQPRDHHVYDHAHESPVVMWAPLIVLSFFAAFVAFKGEAGSLFKLLLDTEPASVAHGLHDVGLAGDLNFPSHVGIEENHKAAGLYALLVAVMGTTLAYLFYGARVLNPAEVKRQFAGVHNFLVEKWQFDILYDAAFVRPVHVIAKWFVAFDRNVLDGFLHATARTAVSIATLDRRFDETVVDGLVNLVGNVTYDAGRSLRYVQTGRLRQYVMFIVLGVVGIWIVMRLFAA